jgi:multidrug efflux pump subunit AcrB
MSNLFFRNPRLTLLSLGLIAVAGLASFHGLPRQEDPTLSRRMGMITTFYPGASASRVESMVTEKIETELQELFEIKTIESTSRTGVSVVFVSLQDRFVEADVDEIWSKVRNRLADSAAVMPRGASAPELEEKTTIAATLVTALVWEGEGPPQIDLLSRLTDDLEQQLRNVSGTRETRVYGRAREEVRVTVDDAALASLGLTVGDVAAAIARADAKVPAGQLRHGRNDILLEVGGALDSIERIRRVPLLQRPDGQVLHVSHVARVEKTVQDPPQTIALVSGSPGVVVSTTMESNLRVDHWSARARATVDTFAADLPDGVGLRLIFDQSVYTDERLGNLATNLVLAAGIVVAVLFFMMGARSALIVGLALPLTLALVLAELKWLGVPLHQTSVTGLIIALGLLIDNAIVVVDDYRAELRGGHAPAAAISRAVRHLFVPLAASTLTTVLAFLPIVLMPGAAGEFIGPIAIGVVLSVTTSFFIAMTLVPAIAGYLITAEHDAGERRWWRDGYSNEKLTAAYRRSLGVTLRTPAVGVAVSLVLPLLGFVVVGTLPEMFFPPNDRNQFQLQMNLPSQSSIEETRRNALRAREIVHAHAEVVDSHWFLGEAAPRVYYNMMGNKDGMSSYAGAYVTTASADATEALLPGLQRELMDAFPNAVVLALPFEQGPPFAAPIEVRIVGPDLDVLRSAGEEMRAIMAETSGVTYTDAELSGGRPKLLVIPDEDEARIAGLRLVDIAEQLNASLEGMRGGSVLESTEEIPVRVRSEGALRQDLSRIATHSLQPSGAGRPASRPQALPGVPLSVLSRVELVPELAGIPHYDGQRINTIQGFLMPYTLIAEALIEFRERLDAAGFELPPGYRLELGGESEQRSEAIANLMAFVGPLLVVMLGTIILSFNSFRFAAVIVVVAMLSVGLAFIGVWAFGHPMGFLAVVGTMGLVGLAINGGIVVLSALKASPAAMAGDLEATREVVIDATRHIIGTTLTTVGGFVPLILFGGRFWPPMATAIAGGVGGSAILSLYLVPSLFMVIARHKARRASEAARASELPHRVEPTRSAA